MYLNLRLENKCSLKAVPVRLLMPISLVKHILGRCSWCLRYSVFVDLCTVSYVTYILNTHICKWICNGIRK